MRTKFMIGMSLIILLLATGLAKSVQASSFDHKIIVVLNSPAEIPGRVLPAGTYVFKTSPDDPNIVQIFNQNEEQVIATLPTISEQAAQVPANAMLMLAETKKDAPEEILSWFYPGDSIGWEFVYPHSHSLGRMQASISRRSAPAL